MQRPKQNWQIYSTRIDDRPAVIMIDLGLRSVAPMATHPHLFCFAIQIKSPDQNGFPSREESGTLHQIEDAVLSAIRNSEKQALHVGKLTKSGLIRHFVYCPPQQEAGAKGLVGKFFGNGAGGLSLGHQVDAAMKSFPGYKHGCSESQEPEWDGYLKQLYPGPWQMQTIMSRTVISELKSRGDRSDQPRQIDHFIVCPDAGTQAKIAAEGGTMGFRCLTSPVDQHGKYGIQLQKEGAPIDIDRHVWPLFQLANKHGARYDGWGAAVVK